MKKISVRLSAILLVLMMLASFSVNVFAAGEFVEWELSEDGGELRRDDGRVYYLLEDEIGVYQYVFKAYCFANEVPYGTIYATHSDSEIVWVEQMYENPRFYATEEGYKQFLELIEGRTEKFRFNFDGYMDTEILADGFITALDAYVGVGTAVTVDVKELRNTERYDVVATDESETFGLTHGAVYRAEGAYYYLNYAELPNNFFDADGNFSYRGGEVTLTLLDSTLESAVNAALETLMERDMENVWEDDSFDFGAVEYTETSMVVFWIFYALIGFILPLPILILGIVLANRRKYRSKYWYVMVGMAGAWMLVSLILLLMLLFL